MSHTSSPGQPRTPMVVLAISALGVVFGDIGTSPLYAVQTVFAIDGGIVTPTAEDVFGVISLIFWSITVIVTIKYVTFVLRADNDGEGGVMALAHLVFTHVRLGGRRAGLVMILGVLGAALFYGDSLITPAISVLSAVEGLKVFDPGLDVLVLPIGVTIVVGLFLVQRRGTEVVGRFFGPVMVLWFVTIAALGLPRIIADPGVLAAILPQHAIGFIVARPLIAFVALGGVVLSITGAEALYADMGHFGPSPIRRAWFLLVFPALVVNYLGQASLVLHNPAESVNPFFHLAPDWAQLPLVILATLATVIASQSVISGAYSVSRQAERLGYFPRLTVRHTSESTSGQIYVPAVNWLVFAGVMLLMIVFQASERLATAYGLAVTGTLLITTALFCLYADAALHWPRWRIVLLGLCFGSIELGFLGANLAKLAHGGWLPVVIAIVVATVMLTWRRGTELVTARRTKIEGSLNDFLDEIHDSRVRYVAGTAVFLHPNKVTTPLALRENYRTNHVLHKEVVIVSTSSENVPHVPVEERVIIDGLGEDDDHIAHISLRFGFSDDPNVPEALQAAVDQGLRLDLENCTYFMSRMTLTRSDRPGMQVWRKRLFIAMAHNAADPTDYFRLPIERTVVMGARVRF